jgi:predicted nucleic acid-binding Zn ribbon protein
VIAKFERAVTTGDCPVCGGRIPRSARSRIFCSEACRAIKNARTRPSRRARGRPVWSWPLAEFTERDLATLVRGSQRTLVWPGKEL